MAIVHQTPRTVLHSLTNVAQKLKGFSDISGATIYKYIP